MGDRAGCARDELLGEKDVWARDRVEFSVKESAVVHATMRYIAGDGGDHQI